MKYATTPNGNGKQINKLARGIMEDLLKSMEEMKEHPDREQFCVNFDEQYKKLKERLGE